MSSKLKGKIALVTGASRGIGQAAAIALAREGAHVILAARTIGGLEATDDAIKATGGSATIAAIDLRDEALIRNLAEQIAERYGRLDILVGNAALLGDLTPLSHVETNMWERVFQVNVTANLHLVRYFDPLLKRSNAGRAMFVTSGIVGRSAAYWGAYAASKAALEEMVNIYAAECANTPIKVNLIDPGGVATGMRASAFPGEDPKTLPTPEAISSIFVELASDDCQHHGKRLHARG